MDYFNERERVYQQQFATYRDHFFRPALIFLRRVGAKPNHISLLGVSLLVMGCLISKDYPWVVMCFFLLHLLCDAIDGPLARLSGKAHLGGALVDIIADQSSVVFIPAAAVFNFGTPGELAVLFASSYLVFIGLVLYANERHIKIRTFIRLKNSLYVLYCISLFANRDVMTVFLAPFTIYYLILIALSLYSINKHYE